jgi:hypothetical protein
LNYKNFKKRNPNPKLNKGKIGFFGGSRRESWEVGIEKFSKYNKLLYIIHYLGLGPNPIPNIFKPENFPSTPTIILLPIQTIIFSYFAPVHYLNSLLQIFSGT